MSHRPWYIGVAFALALGGTAVSEEQTVGNQSDTRKEEASQGDAQPFAVPVLIIENNAQARRADKIQKKSSQREMNDLLAQQGMNAATREIADLSYWQTWFILIGTIALIVTLWLTRQATKAARNAVAVTREIGIAQTRAYVIVEACSFEEFEGGFIISAELKNSGLTPAINARVMGETFSADYPGGGDRNHPTPAVGELGASIGAGGRAISAYRLFTDNKFEALESVKRGEVGFWIQGTAFYDDVFGEHHTTKFRYVLGGRIASGGGVILHADKDGNYAD